MEDISFYPLLVISVLAFTIPLVASRFPGGLVPIVVAEIIAGIVFGRSGLGMIESNPWLEFLSQFGFAYLMFLSGLEVKFGSPGSSSQDTSTRRRNLAEDTLLQGLLVFVLTLIGAGVAAWLLLRPATFSHILFFALILSTTSVGIVVPTLKERDLTREPLGQTILMSAMVADFATVFLITVMAGVLASENPLHVSLIMVLLGFFFLAVFLGGRLRTYRVLQATLEELAHATAQIRVRGALALMLVFVVLAEIVQAELVLGGFLAGAAISSISREEGSALRLKLAGRLGNG